MAIPRSNESIWSRGGGSAARGSPAVRGAPRGTWRSPSAPSPSRGGMSDSIYAGGFRKATGEVGRKPGEMEMLLSPSRGVADDDAASLKNPAVQERFRQHIADKLVKLEATFPPLSGSATRISKRREELGIILLDFRKLREGLTSIRRLDAFAAEVYEASVRTAIDAENWQQLGACLPHLVFDLHPTLADNRILKPSSTISAPTAPPTALADSLASLSLSASPSSSIAPAPALAHQHYFISLYLLHLLCQHTTTSLTTFHTTLALFPTLSSPPVSPHLALVHSTYQALLTSNYTLFARLLSSTADVQQLAILRSAIPAMREKVWVTLQKGYKMPGDFDNLEWLGKVLLFGAGEEEEVRSFLQSKGRKPPPPKVNSQWPA